MSEKGEVATVKSVVRGSKGGRLRIVAARVSPAEYAVLDQKAREAGYSIGSYLRACALGSSGPRARRRVQVNEELLGFAVAQLNSAGSDLKQILGLMNGPEAAGAREYGAVLEETRAAIRQICDALNRG